MKVNRAIENFINSSDYSDNTKNTYASILVKFVHTVFQENETKADASMFSYVDENILNAYKENFVKDSSFVNSISVIRTFMRYLNKEDIINVDMNFFKKVYIPNNFHTSQTETLDSEDLFIFITAMGEEKKYAYAKQVMLLLVTETGIRMEDVVRLKWSNFEEREDGWYMFNFNQYNSIISRKISDELMEVLETLKRGRPEVFPMLTIKSITSSITRTKIRLNKAGRKISYNSFVKSCQEFTKEGFSLDIATYRTHVLNTDELLMGI